MIIAVGDTVWSSMITGVVAIVLAWIGLVANKRLKQISIVGEKTHTLVNSNMAAQLKISAVALRRLADNTKNADDMAAAELAEKLLKEHDAKQASVDARGK